jgi:hypothetical protein
MKNILFTFDYELFLGKKSGTVQNCLIKPTDRLRCLLKEYNCKAIFFVDTTYLLELEKKAMHFVSAREDLNAIIEQLCVLSGEGHDIFPHLHPHWLDATYDPAANEWNLENTRRYRFHVLSSQEKETVFSESIRFLSEILKQINHSRFPMGYRAGGWCLQPFEDFKMYFDRFDIQYDFSVLKGAFCQSDVRYYDFRSLEKQPDIFRFSEDILQPITGGAYTELCISMLRPMNLFENYLARILNKFLPVNFKKSYGDGLSAVLQQSKNMDAASANARESGVMASIELMNAINLRYHFEYLRHRDFLQIISHPKMISDYNLKIFGIFLRKLHSNYAIETDFRKILSRMETPKVRI